MLNFIKYIYIYIYIDIIHNLLITQNIGYIKVLNHNILTMMLKVTINFNQDKQLL